MRVGSVLFACTTNTIRSPMAEALLRRVCGRHIYVASVGVRPGGVDPFAVAVMAELGLDLSRHCSRTFDNLDDGYFDLVVALSPPAHARALEMARASACDIDVWDIPDPTLVEGSREMILDAYRGVRDRLADRVGERFGPPACSILFGAPV